MYDEFYRRHYNELLKYCVAACRDTELAQDLVQETFLKALLNVQTLEDLSDCQRRAWLFRTAKNMLCDHYRRGKLADRYTETLSEDNSYLEPGIERAENRQLLQVLSPEEQMLFTLRYQEGYTASEISEMLHIPAGTVRSKLCRCRTRLKEEVKDIL